MNYDARKYELKKTKGSTLLISNPFIGHCFEGVYSSSDLLQLYLWRPF